MFEMSSHPPEIERFIELCDPCVTATAWPWRIELAQRASSKWPQKKTEIGPEEKKS